MCWVLTAGCDMVVMNNVGAHKLAGAAEAIRDVGANVLYLSPCSSSLNPTKEAFSELKALLRGAAARTKDAFCTINQLLERFKPGECRNYLATSGYKSS